MSKTLLGALMLTALGACTPRQREPIPPRDWTENPAIVELDQPEILYAASDIHGAYARFAELLFTNGVIAAVPATPGDVEWAAGGAMLIIVGDLIDKGPSPLSVIELLYALDQKAPGHVITLIGNHEAEFFADVENDKAIAREGFSTRLASAGIDPGRFAAGSDERAVWLRTRPFAARAGRWFFVHAGNTGGRSIADLSAAIQGAIDARGWGAPEIIGRDSLLESRGWFESDPMIGERYAAAAGAEHIVFGHDPNAIAHKGTIAFAAPALFRIDCGMSPSINDSLGSLLRVRREGDLDVAEALDSFGSIRELWRSP